MQDLIKINKIVLSGAEINSVNARDLWKTLEIKKDFSDWIKSQINSLGLEENIDFAVFPKKGENPILGGRPLVEYIITIDTAKHISMASRTAKGKEVRAYFIEIEKKANIPLTFEQMAKQTILLADKRIRELENKIIEDKPKVAFANAIIGATSHIDFETFAKALFDTEGIKLGRNNLMQWFRNNNYLNSKNKPYQIMLDRGLMSLKEGSYVNQSTQEMVLYTQPRVTGKGQLYFTNKLIDEIV